MYLTIFHPLPSGPRAIAVYDLTKRRFLRNSLVTCPADIEHFDLYGYRSAHPDLLNAKLPRNRSGELLASARPVRLCGAEVVDHLWPKPKADGRGKAEASKANLRDPSRLSEVRFQKPRMVTDEVIARAADMKAKGIPWARIGEALGMNPTSIRLAIRRHAEARLRRSEPLAA